MRLGVPTWLNLLPGLDTPVGGTQTNSNEVQRAGGTWGVRAS